MDILSYDVSNHVEENDGGDGESLLGALEDMAGQFLDGILVIGGIFFLLHFLLIVVFGEEGEAKREGLFEASR